MEQKTKLDYAFLADFAQVNNNKLTVVGASYTYLHTTGLPATHMLSVAGRLRAPHGVESVPLRVQVVAPSKAYDLEVDLEVESSADIRPYAGKVGLLFAVTLQIPLVAAGLYEVLVYVDGERQRRLAFEVQVDEPKP